MAVHSPGTIALREIRKYQRSCFCLIPKENFAEIVRNFVWEVDPEFSIQDEAIEGLQEACESYLVDYFEEANLYTIHRGQVRLIRV